MTAFKISLGVFPTFGAMAITCRSPITSVAASLFAADRVDAPPGPRDPALRELIEFI